jgi:hypothetical protein
MIVEDGNRQSSLCPEVITLGLISHYKLRYDNNSTVSRVPSGVLQGLFSPLLFSLIVSGIQFAIPDRIIMFADDLNIVRRIKSFADSVTLQDELNTHVLWLNSIGLQFNIDQFKSVCCRAFKTRFCYSNVEEL